MQHLDEGTIHTWLDDALSPDEAARVEAHVAECPQCATAVAEARGFIAASSRILTALDHVPRGVVPAALPVQWYNRAAWRAAAAVLVVAIGSLVVVRNTERNKVASSTMSASVRTSDAIAQSQTAAVAASPSAVAATKLQVPPSATLPKRSATVASAAAPGNPSAETGFSGKSVGGVSSSNVAARERALDEAVAGNTMQSAAAEEPPLKVVGPPRMPGAKVTFYEVAPGDTVTLTEASNAQLNAAVATGIPTVEPQARRATAKSAATATARVASPSPAVLPPQAEVANGVTTISWADAATGRMLTLSGRMPVERLKEIKLRIDRERAAAEAKKKL